MQEVALKLGLKAVVLRPWCVSGKPKGFAQSAACGTSSVSESESVNPGQSLGTLLQACRSSPGKRDLPLKAREKRPGGGEALCRVSEQGLTGTSPFLHASATFCRLAHPPLSGRSSKPTGAQRLYRNSRHVTGGSIVHADI